MNKKILLSVLIAITFFFGFIGFVQAEENENLESEDKSAETVEQTAPAQADNIISDSSEPLSLPSDNNNQQNIVSEDLENPTTPVLENGNPQTNNNESQYDKMTSFNYLFTMGIVDDRIKVIGESI